MAKFLFFEPVFQNFRESMAYSNLMTSEGGIPLDKDEIEFQKNGNQNFTVRK